MAASTRSMQRVTDPEAQDPFYASTVRRLLREGMLSTDTRVLVACGGPFDRDVLHSLGFRDVTISNLDERLTGTEFAPFAWSSQDVEQLTFADDEFDFAIVHNGLHHCFSPHRGLLELYRVSRYGVLVFEPRDTLLVRLGMRLGFGQTYEVAAVSHHGLRFGGAGNTDIPNYIYRWTEREVEKAIASYAPLGRHRFVYTYALRVPWSRVRTMRNRVLAAGIIASLPVLRLVLRLFPRQANGFAFAIQKPRLPEDLHPWLKAKDGRVVVDRGWVRAQYDVPD